MKHVTPDELREQATAIGANARFATSVDAERRVNAAKLMREAAATIEALEARAVPEGWVPIQMLKYVDGRLVGEVGVPEFSSSHKWRVRRPTEGVAMWDTWQEAIAAAEAAE